MRVTKTTLYDLCNSTVLVSISVPKQKIIHFRRDSWYFGTILKYFEACVFNNISQSIRNWLLNIHYYISVLKEYRNKREKEKTAELFKALRNIFLRYTNWYEKLFSDIGNTFSLFSVQDNFNSKTEMIVANKCQVTLILQYTRFLTVIDDPLRFDRLMYKPKSEKRPNFPQLKTLLEPIPAAGWL